tara:strand:+ start:1360 stop:1875 length:516 start_codon:yes stop_codon:yes gene_type:complete
MHYFRELVESDLGVAASINNQSFPAVPEISKRELRSLIEMSSFRAAAVDQENVLVGFALALESGAPYQSENYEFFERRGIKHLYVDRIVFLESSQNRGLGSAMYERIFKFAKDQKIFEVTCEVNLEPPNPGSLRFHRRMGFEEVAVQSTKQGKVIVQLLKASLGEETKIAK